MALTVTVPLNLPETDNQGNPLPATFTLQLPQPAVAGSVVWSSSDTTKGTVTPASDGQSALFTPVAAGDTTIHADITNDATAGGHRWKPGKLYLYGDNIIDQNGNVQQVSAASKEFEARYTPLQGATTSFSLAGGTAAWANGIVTISGITANPVIAGLVGAGVISISGATTATSINGSWVLQSASFSSTGTITFASPAGGAGTYGSTVNGVLLWAANLPGGGDASAPEFTYSGSGNYAVGGTAQFGTVLNSDSGDINGDWPAGALLQAGANTNSQMTYVGGGSAAKPAFTASSGPATTKAPVLYVQGGFSSGDSTGSLASSLASSDGLQAGLDSPQALVPYAAPSAKDYQNGNFAFLVASGQIFYPGAFGSVTDSFVQVAFTSVATGTGVYAGTFPSGTAYEGREFAISDFANSANNGRFLCSVQTTSHLTFNNPNSVSDGSGIGVSEYTVNAPYEEIGPSGPKTFVDGAGLTQVGWPIALNTENFLTSVAQPPAFATSSSGGPAGNGTTVDGDLVWIYVDAADDVTSYDGLTLAVSSAAGIPPVPYNSLTVVAA